MTLETKVADHYTEGGLLAAIRSGVHALGKTPETVNLADLGAVDEFHIGGRPATTELGERLELTPDRDVLDLGCGIGGAARFFAATFGCRVTGIDLTPEYVEVARELTAWTGLESRVSYVVGSALALPFEDASFDCATQLHVGMNIEDKKMLFAEVHRVLRAGARFGVYDIMGIGAGDIPFPVPWSSEASTSFVADVEDYCAALEAAGFAITAQREQRAFALEFFAGMRARMAEACGPQPLGLHLVMGDDAQRKIANVVTALEAGAIAPVELIVERP